MAYLCDCMHGCVCVCVCVCVWWLGGGGIRGGIDRVNDFFQSRSSETDIPNIQDNFIKSLWKLHDLP